MMKLWEILIFNMFPEVIFEINTLVNTFEGKKIVVGYAYIEGEIIYVLAPNNIYEDEELSYLEANDIELLEKPKEKFITLYNMGDKADLTEYIGGILKESGSENALYFLTNTEFEPETIHWITIE